MHEGVKGKFSSEKRYMPVANRTTAIQLHVSLLPVDLSVFGTSHSSKALSEPAIGVSATEQAARNSKRIHNGFPVLTQDEYQQKMETLSGDDKLLIHDFRGYIETKEGLFYVDLMAANEIRDGICVAIRGEEQGGYIAGGIFGLYKPTTMRDAKDVYEYTVYILLPKHVQDNEGLVCINNTCENKLDYMFRKLAADYESDEVNQAIAVSQSHDQVIIWRCLIEPGTYPNARGDMQELMRAVCEYIQDEYNHLEDVERFILRTEMELQVDLKIKHPEIVDFAFAVAKA
ncbi:MAG: hypothetical protein ABIJ10_01235 [Candidatus Micrarchaeota archaeon]